MSPAVSMPVNNPALVMCRGNVIWGTTTTEIDGGCVVVGGLCNCGDTSGTATSRLTREDPCLSTFHSVITAIKNLRISRRREGDR